MRDNGWLEKQLQYLLKKNFADVVISNPLEIKFGREAKYRFGSIRLVKPRKLRGFRVFRKLRDLRDEKPQRSIITITSLFAKESVPVEVVHYTIAHELCHYAHGFSSMNRQMFRHPHHGGVIKRELTERGLENLIPIFKRWLKGYRSQILAGR